MNVSVAVTSVDRADLAGDQLEQVLVALGDDLDQHVEGAGGDDDVVDLVERGERVGDRLERPVHPDPDHRLAREPELQRVGDRDDLHHAAVDQPLDALADGGLGQPDDLADGGVRAAAVLLELLDDRLRDVVEGEPLTARASCSWADAVKSAPSGQRFHRYGESRISLRIRFHSTVSLVGAPVAWHDPSHRDDVLRRTCMVGASGTGAAGELSRTGGPEGCRGDRVRDRQRGGAQAAVLRRRPRGGGGRRLHRRPTCRRRRRS